MASSLPDTGLPEGSLDRPEALAPTPVPPLPQVDMSKAEEASTTFSHYRTGLSNHRTALSEHRTSLSEYRTNLSTHRTNLSTHRTNLSTRRTSMSMHRTGMSFQRTRLSADRTLMSVIRTSLSLIGFGFTLYQVFSKLQASGTIAGGEAPRNFGVTLIVVGIVMLLAGMWHHLQFMRELRATRAEMASENLIYGKSTFPISFAFITAVVLMLTAMFAIANIVFGFGPFS